MSRSTPPRLLLVEDDPDAAMMVREVLVDHFGDDSVVHCLTMAQACAIDPNTIDLVLTDMNLPDGTGLELLEHFLKVRPDMPVVVVTSESVSASATAAIRRGAYDYVVKAGDYLFTIPLIVEKNLTLWHTRQENARLQQRLRQTLQALSQKNQQLEEAVNRLQTMAATDPLTGLANRRSFGRVLEQRFAEAMRYDQDMALLMIDLDQFKPLNDTLGHQFGDRMLERAARVLQANCRSSDLAGRFGGDEFIILLPNTDHTTAAHVAQRISEQFRQMTRAECDKVGYDGELTMSMGLATIRSGNITSPEQLIGKADHALYAAKTAGRTCLITTPHQQPA